MPQKVSPYIVASVDRALELLLILGRHPHAMGVTELSKILGVQKSTVHSLLQTMLARGFVQQTDNGRYSLGMRLIHLGEICAERLDIRTAARQIMVELANETKEIALLAVLARDELVIVDKVEPQRPFLIIPKFDFSMAIHSTAVGKVLLAHAPDEIYEAILARGIERFTQFTLTDPEALRRELIKVREQGYALGCNETIEGITCIAVPIYNAGGKVAAALSISSASSMLGADRYEAIIEILKEKAKLISRRLGCTC
ncbi:transcriptional regulator, IclR family [Thermosinus carboxydivorans Nor1]|uniref:Glycerol operon regulatory protein n=1 Tax=Thermosinus carboxydivorans Nor1 TaxID=401526 RepID=A1HTT6_9FIRM|nr:IclR family transcriptional regulator [Thermosinus carboxydivorans]EAX46570.1 transcriptional regulator, IclR family [Thermosinus carboxydivorans Nor1]